MKPSGPGISSPMATNGAGAHPSLPARASTANLRTGSGIAGSTSLIFRRKTERLDWRQIASIDIHALLHSASEKEIESLLVSQLLSQIAYCSIENELLEHDKVDPGFVKVFQIAQLLIEFLLHQHHTAFQAQEQLSVKCDQLAKENQERVKEILTMREVLSQAKRQLQKQKEIIGSGQKVKCQYCNKKFNSPSYLLSHLERRHEDLINSNVPSSVQAKTIQEQNHVRFEPVNNKQQELNEDRDRQQLARPSVELVTMSTQTMPSSLVLPDEEFSITREELPLRKESGPSVIDDAEELMDRMKRDLDVQWVQLASRIQETGIEDFKHVFMGEIHKMKDMINSSVARNVVADIPEIKDPSADDAEVKNRGSSLEASSLHDLQERFQKQEEELHELKNSMQSKMQEDTDAFNGKLQAQERFWRMKLRQVEERYETQAVKLREEIQLAMATSTVKRDAELQKEEANAETEITSLNPETEASRSQSSPPPSPIRTSTPKKHAMVPSQISGTKSKSNPTSPEFSSNKVVPNSSNFLQVSSKQKPVPKARPRTPQPVPRKKSPPAMTGLEAGTVINHEYEEPDSHRLRNQNQIEDRADDDDGKDISNYETSDEEDGSSNSSADEDKKSEVIAESENSELGGQREKLELIDKRTQLREQQMQLREIRESMLKHIDRKLDQLGMRNEDRNGTEEAEEVAKQLAELIRRRDSLVNVLGEDYPERRDHQTTRMNFMAKPQAADNKFQSQAQDVSLHRGQLPSTPSKRTPTTHTGGGSGSPIVKMFSAVKQKGAGWKEKVVTSFKKDKTQTQTRRRPRTPKMTGSARNSGKDSVKEAENIGVAELPLNFHQEMSQMEKIRKAKKKSFFSRTKAKFSRKGKKSNGAQALPVVESTESMVARRLRQDLQDDDEEEDDGIRPAPLAVASPTRPKSSHYSKPMKVKSIRNEGPKLFSPVQTHLQPQTAVALMYPSEEALGGSGSEGSDSDSEETSPSERIRKLAKSLSDRKNNPESFSGHYQKHGAAAVVKRNLLQEFEEAEPDEPHWKARKGVYDMFQAKTDSGGNSGESDRSKQVADQEQEEDTSKAAQENSSLSEDSSHPWSLKLPQNTRKDYLI